jgi:hypothetical protein
LDAIAVSGFETMDRRSPAAAPLDELRTKWRGRRDEFARFRASVDGAALCDELLADLEEAILANGDELLTLSEAARLSGYTADHLGRLVRDGKIANAGRPHAPRIRRGALPRKHGLRDDVISRIVPSERERIVRAVVHSKTGD